MKNLTYDESALSFFLLDYFGTNLADDKISEEELVKICAHRAYLDFNRTLEFSKGIDDNYRYYFRSEIVDYIESQINHLIDSQNQSTFNKRHNDICKVIVTMANSAETNTGSKVLVPDSFHYGQAQKWLNMTTKYMFIIGAHKDINKVKELLHIPVDRYIIKEIYKIESIVLPKKGAEEIKEKKLYGVDKIVSWSQWTGKDYRNFRKSIQNYCKNKNKIPNEWENEKWIEISQEFYKKKKTNLEKERKGKIRFPDINIE